MGLAASQARFLGITARKNTCELRSMQIAQEKLSITNQLTQIAENYQNSLDATRLVWDSEYIDDGAIYDLDYSLLMTPSKLNDYSPQLLTNVRNQIVLDSQFALAIQDMIAGADADGNNLSFALLQTGGANRNITNFKTFLECLNKGGILSKCDLDKMIKALNGNSKFYSPDNGVGGVIQEKFTTNSMNLPTLKSYIKNICDPSSQYVNDMRERFGTSYDSSGNKKLNDDGTPQINTKYDDVVELGKILNFQNISHSYDYTDKSGTAHTGDDINFSDYCNYKKDTELKLSNSNFNFGDLLTKEITLSSDNAGQMGDALCKFVDSIYQIMLNFFEVNPQSVDMEYLNFAMTEICSLNGLTWKSQTDTNPTAHAEINDLDAAAYSTGDQAFKHTGLIKNGSNYQVSLSNLSKGVLTYFEKAIEGFESGYCVESNGDKKTENSFYITQDSEYFYFVNNPEALDEDDNTQLLLDYYSQLFNQICLNGWTRNDRVTNQEDLKNMLKNGTLFTSSLADDGKFYQGPYTSNNYIAEVADEDAITRAEAEYKTRQLQLSAKEEELNIDMQLIDAELAALTTEYDTVKGMISKAIEKGFSTLGG